MCVYVCVRMCVYVCVVQDRERTVTMITTVVSTIYFCVMAFLLWPTRADAYFQITTPDVTARVDYEGL